MIERNELDFATLRRDGGPPDPFSTLDRVPTNLRPPRNGEWDTTPADLALGNQDVHVWRASLRADASSIMTLAASLAPDEVARANRFHFAKDRDHFITARGVLRALLGRYLGIAPDQIQFAYGPQGKPSLAMGSLGAGLEFNIAHSHGEALVAVAKARRVGIDLELIRPEFAGEEIAKQFFSPEENEALRALPRRLRVEGFFRCWTRKEAYIKALGGGLSIPLDQFSVSLIPGQPVALLSAHGKASASAVSGWSLMELDPGPGYVGAVAVEGQGSSMRRLEWRGSASQSSSVNDVMGDET